MDLIKLNKYLSKLDDNNVTEKAKLRRLKVMFDDNNKIYLVKLRNHRKFLILHLAKLFFYWNYTKKSGLNNADWTKDHWIEEIIALFRFTDSYDFYNPKTELKLKIEKLDVNYREILKTNIFPNEEIEQHKDIIDKLTNGSKEDDHELPPIDFGIIKNKWDNFISFCKLFINKTIERLIYSPNPLDMLSITRFIECSVNKSYDTYAKLDDLTKWISFSEWTDEERYRFVKYYFSNNY